MNLVIATFGHWYNYNGLILEPVIDFRQNPKHNRLQEKQLLKFYISSI